MNAIRMFTIYASYTEFEEEIKGSIEPWKLADMMVLDGDPFCVPPEKIKEINVDMTVIDGEIRYSRNN